MPSSWSHRVVVVNNIFYLFGFSTLIPATSTLGCPAYGSNAMYTFDPSISTWSLVTVVGSTVPPARYWPGMVVVNSIIYVFVGSLSKGVDLIYSFSFFSLSAFLIHEYKGGGSTGCGSANFNDLWSFSPSTRKWAQITPSTSSIPLAVVNPRMAPSEDSFYMYGGARGTNQTAVTTLLWQFNTSTSSWTQVTQLRSPTLNACDAFNS